MPLDSEQVNTDVGFLTSQPGWQDAASRTGYIRDVAVKSLQDPDMDPEHHAAVLDKLWGMADDRNPLEKTGEFLGNAGKEFVAGIPATGGAVALGVGDTLGITHSGSGTRLVRGVSNMLDAGAQRIKSLAPNDAQEQRDAALKALKTDLDSRQYPPGLEAWISGAPVDKLDDETKQWVDGLTFGLGRKAVAADHHGPVDAEKVRAWVESDRSPARPGSDTGGAGPRALLGDYLVTRDPASWKAFTQRVSETDTAYKSRLERYASEPELRRVQTANGNGVMGGLTQRSAELQGDPVMIAATAVPLLRGAKAFQAAKAGASAAAAGSVVRGMAEAGALTGTSAALHDPNASAAEIAEAAGMGAAGAGMLGTAGALLGHVVRGKAETPNGAAEPVSEQQATPEASTVPADQTDAVAAELFGNTGKPEAAETTSAEAPSQPASQEAVAPPAPSGPTQSPPPPSTEAPQEAAQSSQATNTPVSPRARMAQRILENKGVDPEVAAHMGTLADKAVPPHAKAEDFREAVLSQFEAEGGRFPGNSGMVLNDDPKFWEAHGHSPDVAAEAAENSRRWMEQDRQQTEENNRSLLGQTEAVAPAKPKGFVNTAVLAPRSGGFIHIPPEFAKTMDHAVELIRRGITDFAQWSAEMLKKFGEAIRSYLKDIWAAAQKSSQTGALNLHALNQAKASLKQERSVGKMKGFLSALADVAQNAAGIKARQAGNHIRQKFGMGYGKEATAAMKRDMDAAAFVVEAPIDAELARAAAGLPKGASVTEAKAALAGQIASVQRNATPEMQRKWLPVMQHALANYDDLSNKAATSQQLLHAEQMQEKAYGIDQGHVEHYVSHIYANLDEIKGAKAPQPLFGGGSPGAGNSRYFVKGRAFATLADAIAAGYDPQSTNIADLAEYRIKHGQVLIEQAKAREELMTATDPASGQRIVRPHLTGDYFEINSGRGTAVQGHIYRTADKWAVEQGGTRMLYPDLAAAKVAVASTGAKLSYKRSGGSGSNVAPDYRKVDMAGTDVQVYAPYEGLMDALYGRGSKLRNSLAGRVALRTAQGIKHGQVGLDIVHVGNVAWTQLFGGGGFGYSKGLSILEHSPADMARMLRSGEIDKATFDFYQKSRPLLDAGVKAGLNVGRISDAIYADTVSGVAEWLRSEPDWLWRPYGDAVAWLPAQLGKFAPWVFDKLTRGAMVQTFLKFQERYLGFGMSLEEASKAAALEVNRAFGNVGMQGIFKSRTWQDAARVVLFAPQWAEGRLTMELQGIKQLGAIPLDALRGKFQVGNIARMQMAAALTFLAMAQAVNYATTGHSTFENEDDHKLDAWLPGGPHGMWFSPLTVLAHNTEQLHRYYSDAQARAGGDKLLALEDAVLQLVKNKTSAPVRAEEIIRTRTDYSGTRLQTAQGVAIEGALTMLPVPIPFTSLMRHGPGEWPQLTLAGAQPGAVEKQLFASLGIHVVNARGPQDKMYSLARPFRNDGAYNPEPSKYTQIRRDLKAGFTDDARDRMIGLLSSGDAALDRMDEAMGWRGGMYHKPLFTGTTKAEHQMKSSLGPTDRALYDAAQKEHREQAQQYWDLRRSILPQLKAAAKGGKAELERKTAETKAKTREHGAE